MMRAIISFFIVLVIGAAVLSGCQHSRSCNLKNEDDKLRPESALVEENAAGLDTIIISSVHRPNHVVCDLDGDKLKDTTQIVQNTNNQKYGLRFIFGNGKIEFMGMGEEVLNRGFDDFDWVGEFYCVPKGGVYFNNVNDDGEIVDEDDVDDSEKIKLPHDGIFMHELESCGGGIIYLRKGNFEWIQQD